MLSVVPLRTPIHEHALSVTCVFAAYVVRRSGDTISSLLFHPSFLFVAILCYKSNQFTSLDIKAENQVSNRPRASFSVTLFGANSRVSSGKKSKDLQDY